MGRNRTVELNGKRYDSTTGVLLGKTRSKSGSNLEFKHYRQPVHSSRTIDGFSRETNIHNIIHQKAQAAIDTTVASNTIPNVIIAKQPLDIKSLPAHQPERPKTLMRSIVNKQPNNPKPIVKTQLPIETSTARLNNVTQKYSAAQVDPSRLARARNTVKSSCVKRFDIKQTPEHVDNRQTTAEINVQINNHNKQSQDEDDIFELALAAATSHEQKSPKIKKHHSRSQKLIKGLAAVCLLVVVGIFITYLNLPNIEVNVADMRAGIHATLPNYKSLGFTLDGLVKANNGIVAMNFLSGNSSFMLTQKVSNWDNQTLLETTASEIGAIPKVIQTNGRTIFFIHSNNATWVSGGILYNIIGNTNLNSQQISSIADSM